MRVKEHAGVHSTDMGNNAKRSLVQKLCRSGFKENQLRPVYKSEDGPLTRLAARDFADPYVDGSLQFGISRGIHYQITEATEKASISFDQEHL
jgi:hypothetical protein